jgi:putative inorganic carbon (HCO3(-)) transporter
VLQNSYFYNLSKRFLQKTDALIDRCYYPSLTATLMERLGLAYRSSFTGQLMARDLVGESWAYKTFQGIIDFCARLVCWPTVEKRAEAEGGQVIYPQQYHLRKPVVFGLIALFILLGVGLFFLLPWSQALQILGGVLLVAAVLYRVEFGVYAAALALPFVPFKALFMLSLLTLFSLVMKWRWGKIGRLHFSPFWVPLLLFFLIQFYATITSVYFWPSVSEFLIPVTGLIYLFVMVNVFDRPAKLDNFLLCLAFAGLVTASYATYQYFAGPSMEFLNQNWVDESQTKEIKNRAYAVFDNPNLLAQYLVLLTSVTLGALFATRSWRRRGLFALTVVTSVCCLLLTYSRGGWIAFVAGLLVFGYFFNRRRLITFLPIGAVAGYFLIPAWAFSRLATAVSLQDSSNAYRLDTWNSTLSLVREYWLTGVGLGRQAFARVYGSHMINTNFVPHSHNLCLQLISEFGILGLAVFLWLFWRLFRLGCRLRVSGDAFIRSLNAGVMAAMAGFLIHSLIDYFLWYYKLGILIWLLIGIMLVLERLENKEEVGVGRREPRSATN